VARRATARKEIASPEPNPPAPVQEFLPKVPRLPIDKDLLDAFIQGLASRYLSHLGLENLSIEELEARYDAEPTLEAEIKAGIAKAIASLGSEKVQALFPKLAELEQSGQPAPVPAKIAPPATTQARKMVSDERSFMHEGVRYFPLSVATPIIQVPRTTLIDWIRKGKTVGDKPLQVHYSEAAARYFISEESIERAALRFVKWPSEQPAGIVHLGETANGRGYIGLKQAAREIGISDHTMWLWAARGKAPGHSPDVIKCPVTEQYYIHQAEIGRLRKLVPDSGLRPGPRRKLDLKHSVG
jgi:hypothetical protein